MANERGQVFCLFIAREGTNLSEEQQGMSLVGPSQVETLCKNFDAIFARF